MSLTGAVLGDRCFVTPDDAVDAYFSGAAPVFTTGATSYLNEFVKDSGVWKQKSWSIDAAGTSTLRYIIDAPIPSFQSCDPSQSFLDGMTVGWGIATVLVTVFCIKLIEKTK